MLNFGLNSDSIFTKIESPREKQSGVELGS